jgi:hypothetical protein
MHRFFSKTVYMTALRRNWVGSALLTVVFILIALGYHTSISYNYHAAQADLVRLRDQAGLTLVGTSFIASVALLVAAASVLCGVVVFSYLHNKRATVMMHAIPVRREAHFVSAFLGGLTLLWAPIALLIAGVAAAQASAGLFYGSSLLIFTLMMLLVSLAAYSLTVFAAFLAGSVMGQLSVTALILALPPLVEVFINQLFNYYLFGYSGFTMWFNQRFHIAAIYGRIADRAFAWLPHINYEEGFRAADLTLILFLLGYCAAFIAGSLLLYRTRRFECAGDFIAVRGMRPVFRYGSAFLAAFMFGQFGAAVTMSGSGALLGAGIGASPVWLGYSIVGGIIGFFVAEMFIRKTVKVHKRWKGALLFTGCYLAVFFAVFFDITGYGSYVLPRDRVESIYLSAEWLPREGSADRAIQPIAYMFTGENMSAALDLQEYIAKNGKAATKASLALPTADTVTGVPMSSASPYDYDGGRYYIRRAVEVQYVSYHFNMTAKLTNGRTVERRYNFLVPKTDEEWGIKIAALNEAARPQSLERLRNVGKAASRLEITHNYWISDWEWEVLAPRHMTLYGGEIEGFIEALILDNQEFPKWEGHWNYRLMAGIGQYTSSYEVYGMNNMMELLTIRAVVASDNLPHFANSIQIRVYSSDVNALDWLTGRGYITQELIERHIEIWGS